MRFNKKTKSVFICSLLCGVIVSTVNVEIIKAKGVEPMAGYPNTSKSTLQTNSKTKKINTIKKFVTEANKIFNNGENKPKTSKSMYQALADECTPEVALQAEKEIIDSINSQNFSDGESFGQTKSGIEYKINTDDVLEESEAPSIQTRSISGDQAVKNNVKKEFGYRRYDATIDVAWVRIIFHTHYYAGSNGLTLANFKDSSRVGMDCDIERNTAPMWFSGEMGTGYEDGRAEKVGYDINAVGKWKIGIDVDLFGIKLPMYKQEYVVSFVKLIEQGSNYVKVNEKIKIYSLQSEFNF